MFPAWDARIVHVPPPTIVTVSAATVHTAVVSELKDTGSPDVAVAATSNGGSPYVFPPASRR